MFAWFERLAVTHAAYLSLDTIWLPPHTIWLRNRPPANSPLERIS